MDFDLLLIQKMKRGNEKAFDVFVHKYYEKILKYCRYHCLDTSYAEDLTQETFLHFLKNYLITVILEKHKIICIP